MAAVTVGTTAVRLAYAGGAGGAIRIQNRGAAEIFVEGTNAVTTATGFGIAAGASLTYPLQAAGEVWAISGTAGQDVRVLLERGG